MNQLNNANNANILKIKNNFSPKIQKSVNVAKRDLQNKIITNPTKLRQLYANHFQHRMRTRPILSKYKIYESFIKNRFQETLKSTSKNRAPDWKIEYLEKSNIKKKWKFLN